MAFDLKKFNHVYNEILLDLKVEEKGKYLEK